MDLRVYVVLLVACGGCLGMVYLQDTCPDIPPDCPPGFTCCFETYWNLYVDCNRHSDVEALNNFLDGIKRNLTAITLKHCLLRAVPTGVGSHRYLTELNLNYNEIMKLSPGIFSNLTSLSVLELAFNSIHTLEVGCFQGLVKLQRLNLRNVINLASFSNDVFLHDPLPLLSSIDFSLNHLEEIDTWIFKLPMVQKGAPVFIDFSKNSISKLTNSQNITIDDFRGQYRLNISLKDNSLEYFDNVNIIKLFNVSTYSQLKQMWNMTVDVRNNKWDCGCDMYEFVHFVKPLVKYFNTTLRDLDLIQVFCKRPSYNVGKLIYKMSETDFRCNIRKRCPQDCVCWRVPANDTMLVSCERSNTSLPDSVPLSPSISLMLPHLSIHQLSLTNYLHNVSYFDLGDNNLTLVDDDALHDISQKVKILNLSKNNISELPLIWSKLSWSKLEQIWLSGNPIDCSCAQYPLQMWLEEHRSLVVDATGILCSDERHSGASIISLKYSTMCGKPGLSLSMWVIIAIVVGSVLVLIAIIVIAVISLRKKVSLQISRSQMKARIAENNTERKYDTFLVYADDSSQWVRNVLLTKLEDENNLRVCLHERDFIPAQLISQNIIVGISQSRSILVVISPKMMASDWCKFECHMATVCSQQLGPSRVSVISVVPPDQPVIDLDKAPSFLKTLIKMSVVLRSEDEVVECLKSLVEVVSVDEDEEDQSENRRLMA